MSMVQVRNTRSILRDFPEITYELGQQGNHEIEKTNGLNEGETENGVGEQLSTEGRVAGSGVQKGGEHKTNTNTGTSQTDGSVTHTNVLGDLDHGLGNLGAVCPATLEGISGGAVDDLGDLLTLNGLESVGVAWRSID
jgi:hypothetical protein